MSTMIGTKADDGLVRQVDAVARAYGCNRSEAIRILLRVACDQPDRVRDVMLGYQEGLRLGGRQIGALLGAAVQRAGDLMRLIDGAVAAAGTMRAVPVTALYPGEPGASPG